MRQVLNWFTCWHIALLIGAMYAFLAICAGWERWMMIREMSRFSCPQCGIALGTRAVRAGSDVSPFEEIWGDDAQIGHWHCHPTCRKINCAACSAVVVLRWNRQGAKCGPRMAIWSEDGEYPCV
jgi:hypothetical protein